MAEKNRTKSADPKDSIELVKSGLLFLAVKLGDLLDEIVGWWRGSVPAR